MSTQPETKDPNAHIVDFLNHYCKADSPFDYAIMLSGPWGSGKTYLINKFLEERSNDESSKHLYVSLYGMTSCRQIDEALIRQLHPILRSKGMRIATEILKGTLKTALKIDLTGTGHDDVTISSKIPDLDILDYFETPQECILIFDDLERCLIPISEVLGYINSFVEHEHLKVILLGDESEIVARQDDRYNEIKEKLVGRTFKVRSAASSAITKFLDVIRDQRTKEFLGRHIDHIINLHTQSDTKNLRILKQSLWDFERLALCFCESHWIKEEPILILLDVVLALSFEIRSGRLTEGQFAEIQLNKFIIYMNEKRSGEESIVTKLGNRYRQVRFDQTVINPEWIKSLLFTGRVDADEVRHSLNSSHYYTIQGIEEAWKVAWHFWDTDDDTFEKSVAEIESQFKERSFTVPGEMFHIFGLRLFFSNIGAIAATRDLVVRQCMKYIDSLRGDGRIPDALTMGAGLDRTGTWDGLGFMDFNSAEFQEILRYYRRIVDAVAADSLPTKGLQLLNLLEDNPEAYFRELCINNVAASRYFNVPVLAAIPPDVFVKRVLGLNADSQRVAFTAFKARYETGFLERELEREKNWLRTVEKIFVKESATLRPLSRFRIRNYIGQNIDPFLQGDGATEA